MHYIENRLKTPPTDEILPPPPVEELENSTKSKKSVTKPTKEKSKKKATQESSKLGKDFYNFDQPKPVNWDDFPNVQTIEGNALFVFKTAEEDDWDKGAWLGMTKRGRVALICEVRDGKNFNEKLNSAQKSFLEDLFVQILFLSNLFF